jgi:hypothetical protein
VQSLALADLESWALRRLSFFVSKQVSARSLCWDGTLGAIRASDDGHSAFLQTPSILSDLIVLRSEHEARSTFALTFAKVRGLSYLIDSNWLYNKRKR